MSNKPNRYRIVLHIGLTKTGSSALQFFFTTHADLLTNNGVYYYILEPDVAQGKISSGNAVGLMQYLRPQNRTMRFREEAFFEEFKKTYFKDSETILLTNEVLYQVDETQLKKFIDFLKPYADLTVVAYVRDYYGSIYSNWMQRIKRHRCTQTFGEFAKTVDLQFANELGMWKRHTDDLRVGHYNTVRKNLINDFLQRAGIPLPADKITLPPKVNRSLDFKECILLSKLNEYHKGVYSRELSDALIIKMPEKETPLPIVPEIAQVIESRFAEQIRRINDMFFEGDILKAIDSSGASTKNMPEVEIPKEDELIYQRLVEMLLERDATIEDFRSRLFYWQAQFHIDKQNYPKAIQMLNECIKRKPDWQEAINLLNKAKDAFAKQPQA